MFENYTLSRTINYPGRQIRFSLFVDCREHTVATMLLVNGKITHAGTPPAFWLVGTPAKAEEWFRKINFDRIAEQVS